MIGRFECLWIDLAALFSGVPVEGRSLVTIYHVTYSHLFRMYKRESKNQSVLLAFRFRRSKALSVRLILLEGFESLDLLWCQGAHIQAHLVVSCFPAFETYVLAPQPGCNANSVLLYFAALIFQKLVLMSATQVVM